MVFNHWDQAGKSQTLCKPWLSSTKLLANFCREWNEWMNEWNTLKCAVIRKYLTSRWFCHCLSPPNSVSKCKHGDHGLQLPAHKFKFTRLLPAHIWTYNHYTTWTHSQHKHLVYKFVQLCSSAIPSLCSRLTQFWRMFLLLFCAHSLVLR